LKDYNARNNSTTFWKKISVGPRSMRKISYEDQAKFFSCDNAILSRHVVEL
jgi:hypothetical protein